MALCPLPDCPGQKLSTQAESGWPHQRVLRGSEPPPPLLCCLIRKMLGSVQCFSPHPLRWSHTGFLPSLIQSLHCLMFYSLENPHEVMLSSFLWLHSICRKSHEALLCFLCLSGFASGNPQLRPWDSPFSLAFHQESSTARVSSVRGATSSLHERPWGWAALWEAFQLQTNVLPSRSALGQR